MLPTSENLKIRTWKRVNYMKNTLNSWKIWLRSETGHKNQGTGRLSFSYILRWWNYITHQNICRDKMSPPPPPKKKIPSFYIIDWSYFEKKQLIWSFGQLAPYTTIEYCEKFLPCNKIFLSNIDQWVSFHSNRIFRRHGMLWLQTELTNSTY